MSGGAAQRRSLGTGITERKAEMKRRCLPQAPTPHHKTWRAAGVGCEGPSAGKSLAPNKTSSRRRPGEACRAEPPVLTLASSAAAGQVISTAARPARRPLGRHRRPRRHFVPGGPAAVAVKRGPSPGIAAAASPRPAAGCTPPAPLRQPALLLPRTAEFCPSPMAPAPAAAQGTRSSAPLRAAPRRRFALLCFALLPPFLLPSPAARPPAKWRRRRAS